VYNYSGIIIARVVTMKLLYIFNIKYLFHVYHALFYMTIVFCLAFCHQYLTVVVNCARETQLFDNNFMVCLLYTDCYYLV